MKGFRKNAVLILAFMVMLNFISPKYVLASGGFTWMGSKAYIEVGEIKKDEYINVKFLATSPEVNNFKITPQKKKSFFGIDMGWEDIYYTHNGYSDSSVQYDPWDKKHKIGRLNFHVFVNPGVYRLKLHSKDHDSYIHINEISFKK